MRIGAADASFGTGMRPATPEDRAWIDQHMVKPKKIKLNALALDRLNAHRRQSGLEAIDGPVAAMGEEVVPEGTVGVISALAGPTGLPDAVDNSALPSFPPIRNQGGLGICASFSSTYYAATHMLGLVRGYDNRNDDDNSTKLSPKWVYNMINGGNDSGSFFTDAFKVLQRHGAATWADFPYTADTNAVNYREWPRDAAVWRKAINFRMGDSGKVSAVDTAEGLNNIKTLLANGYVLVVATDIFGWQFVTIADDPTTTADNALVGKPVCGVIKIHDSGHAVTIVGYNDNVWVDLNKNGVVDSGEKGALRIANSWGKDWVNSDQGFTWIAYDALKAVSAVKGVDNTSRAPSPLDPTRTPFWYNEAYWITARSSYTPKLLGQFTVNHKARSEVAISLGVSSSRAVIPSTNWVPATLNRNGGKFGFAGTPDGVDATFVFDFSEIAAVGPRYYLSVADANAGNAGTVSDFRLTDNSGTTLTVAANGVPLSADNSTNLAYVSSFVLDPPVIISLTSASATVGVPFVYAILSSKLLSTYAAVGLPLGLTLDPILGIISGKPARAGTFNVSLSANNSGGTGGANLTLSIVSGFVPAPVISSPGSVAGTVGQAFSYAIAASDFPDSYSASGLPKGVQINSASGQISGTLIEAGVYLVQLSAANVGGTGSKTLTITVNPPPAGSPVITSPVTTSVTAGNRFTYRITASNNPLSFGADNLPSELSLDTATGVITGIPRLAREYTIFISARNAIGTHYQVLVLTVFGDSSFGPANDRFVNRPQLVGTNTVITGGNFNATAETGEPDHSGFQANKSVWWTWTSPAGGLVSISVANSDFNAILGVYTGTNVNGLTAVQRTDSGASPQIIDFTAVAGKEYQIAVDGRDGASGTVNLSLRFAGAVARPANDNFASRETLAGSDVAVAAQNLNATRESSEPNHDGKIASKSVWWAWTAPATGIVTISTKTSDFDTVLAIYTGTALSTLTPVSSDDESGGNGTSQAIFLATAGTVYAIAVDGYNGADGHLRLTLSLDAGAVRPPNDNFADRITLTGTNVTAFGTNINATAEPGEPRHAGFSAGRSIWWTWTSPATGIATVDTIGSDFDTLLAVYVGNGLNVLSDVASNDDGGGRSTSSLYFNAVAGSVYQIAVDGFDGTGHGRGVAAVHIQFQGGSPANDDFSKASPLAGTSATAAGSNVNATSEPGEPDRADSQSSRSVWWTWTAPSSGLVTITTKGSDFDTILGVFEGSVVSQLAEVASNDDDGAETASRVDFVAQQGATYRISVDGFEGISGKIALSLVLLPSNGALYQTDFENFASGWGKVVGTDGWRGNNTGGKVQGIVNAFTGMGKGVILGLNTPVNTNQFVSIYRPINYDPIAQGTPLVSFKLDMAIFDSTKPFKDEFDFTVYNRAGEFVGSVIFDTATHKVFYENSVGAVNDSGKTFVDSGFYTLTVSMNFLANSWSANLGATLLFTNQPFNIAGTKLDLGYVAIEWLHEDGKPPGDNELVFDNFSLTAGSSTSAPLITSQPQGADLQVGGTVSFRVAASGFPAPVFQWLKNGSPLDGKTGAKLDLINAALTDAGVYTVRASNSLGVATSSGAILTVSVPPPGPAISVQPQSQTVSEGASTSFSVAASGTGLLTYQWKLNGTNVAGATAAVYQLANAQAAHAGNYTVTITDSTGATTSNVADLVVNRPGILFSTGFEASEGYSANLQLTAQKGWRSVDSGANGLTNAFAGLGQQAYIGLVPPNGTNRLFLAWKPINFVPTGSSNPIVKFSVDFEIRDSTNGRFDDFGWSIYNIAGSQLFGVSFNNTDKKVYYSLDDSVGLTATSVTFTNGVRQQLVITMDFSQNTWDAALGTVTVVTRKPITTARSTLDLGDIDAFWLFNPNSIGNNSMIFDNYKVENVITAPPLPVAPKFVVAKAAYVVADGSIQLTLDSGNATTITIESSTDLVSWQSIGTAVKNGTTATFVDKSGRAGRKFYRAIAN